MKRPILLCILCLAIVFGTSVADVPQTMSYQGVLSDGSGVPVPDGTYNLTFRLYAVAIGGTSLWGETQTLFVEDAIFNAILGSVTTLNLPFDNPYWLGVSVDGGAELTPRVALAAAPYAFRTRYGDGDWEFSGSNIYRLTGNVGVGTSSPSARIDVSTGTDKAVELTSSGIGGNMTLYAANPSGSVGCFYTMGAGGYPGTPTAVYGSAGATGNGGFFTCYGDNNYGLIGQSNAGGTALWGWAFGTGYAGYFTGGQGVYCDGMTETQQFKMSTGSSNGYVLTSNATGVGTWKPASGGSDGDWTITASDMYSTVPGHVGIGLTAPTAKLEVYNDTPEEAMEVKHGGAVASRVVNLERVSMPNSANDLLQLKVPSGSPADCQFIEAENGSAVNFAVDADGSIWAVGELVVSGTEENQAHISTSSVTDSTRAVSGVVTGTGSTDAVGVYGESVPDDYWGIGGWFQGGYSGAFGIVYPTGSADYHGTIGYVDGGTGANYGVQGLAMSGVTNYGVYGDAWGGTTNYAGYFSGDAHVTGTFTAGVKSFKIDHPLDPENRYLVHSCVESDEMMNVYNGNVTLDARGEAWVEMPEWFEALNQDFRYQLTAVGAPGPNLYVAEKISGNRFRIAGGEPGSEVSWQVTGVRHDPLAVASRMSVEVDKPANEVGTYMHPEAYGMPLTAGVDYREEREIPRGTTSVERTPRPVRDGNDGD